MIFVPNHCLMSRLVLYLYVLYCFVRSSRVCNQGFDPLDPLLWTDPLPPTAEYASVATTSRASIYMLMICSESFSDERTGDDPNQNCVADQPVVTKVENELKPSSRTSPPPSALSSTQNDGSCRLLVFTTREGLQHRRSTDIV